MNTKALDVCFQVVIYGCKNPGEFWGIVLESFFISVLVIIILALIKKGVKNMLYIYRNAFDKWQRPKQNEQEMKRKSGIEWV